MFMRFEFLAISLLLLLFFSCKTEHSQSQSEVVTKTTNKKMASIGDTIFLDYRFGMSQYDFYEHTKELIDSGELFKNDDGLYAHKLVLGDLYYSKDLEAVFSPEYYNDILYKLSISVKSKTTIKAKGINQLIQLDLFKILRSKYGFNYTTTTGIIDGADNYVWSDGKKTVEVMCGFDDARIFYEDTSISEIIEEDEKSKNQKDIEKSHNSF